MTPKRSLPLPLLLLLAAGAILAALNLFLGPIGDPDDIHLAQARATRLAAFKLGEPLPSAPSTGEPLEARLSQVGLKLGAPLFVRIFKSEFELEIWLKRDGRFHLFATYPICYFSGRLGPKLQQGDHQSPDLI